MWSWIWFFRCSHWNMRLYCLLLGTFIWSSSSVIHRFSSLPWRINWFKASLFPLSFLPIFVLELVNHPGILVWPLVHPSSFLLEPLNQTLVNAFKFVDQMAGCSVLLRVDMANDHNTDVNLFLTPKLSSLIFYSSLAVWNLDYYYVIPTSDHPSRIWRRSTISGLRDQI